MQQPQATNTTPLSKPCLFLPLAHSPLKKNTDYLLSPATGHLYCPSTGSIYQNPASNVPLFSNMQQLPGKMDTHLNYPPAHLPQVQIKPETVLSQSQKKKIERKNAHDHVRKSDKPPTFLHQARNKQKLTKEACPSGKTKKKPKGKNIQSEPIMVNDPSINLKPQDKKPPDTESKLDLTMHLYCPTTGSIYQSPASSVPLSSNMQQLPGKMDIHLNYPPAPLPQVQIKPETVLSQSQKKKIERKNVHDHVRKSDKPPTFLHQEKNKHKLPKEACPSGKTKKKPTGKNMQSKPIKVNDPSINLKPQDKKPPDTESKYQLTTQSYPHAERKSAKSKYVLRKKRKKVKNTKPKKLAKQASPAITSETCRPHKRWRPKKQKRRISTWSFLKRFNRKPRKKTHRRHRTKESVWASKCKNCVLASLVHDIVKSPFTKTSGKLMPVSQLRAMLSSGSRKLIPHQAWMRSMEEEAIWKYKKMKSDCKHKVQVTDYEVVSHQEMPWLVGLCMWVIDRHTKEKWPLLVKCLYKYPDSTIRYASKHRSFCLKWNEVDYTLRNDHTCYTQIQCLLAITDKIYAELLVHTHKETTIIPVYFDADFWEETEIRLETFYTNNVQPYLKDKGIEQDVSSLDIVDNSEE